MVVDSGPVLVAEPFRHNLALCDSALGYAQGSVAIPAPAPDFRWSGRGTGDAVQLLDRIK